MTSKRNKARAAKAAQRRVKKRPNMLAQENITYIDYKDVNLLQRFMSDRSRLRARRMTGNDVQQQRDIATAVKNAREMALLPYTKRVAATRMPRGRDGDGPRGRDGERPRRDAAAPAAAPAATTAPGATADTVGGAAPEVAS
jgi:small subunit ribosomal protein S18